MAGPYDAAEGMAGLVSGLKARTLVLKGAAVKRLVIAPGAREAFSVDVPFGRTYSMTVTEAPWSPEDGPVAQVRNLDVTVLHYQPRAVGNGEALWSRISPWTPYTRIPVAAKRPEHTMRLLFANPIEVRARNDSAYRGEFRFDFN